MFPFFFSHCHDYRNGGGGCTTNPASIHDFSQCTVLLAVSNRNDVHRLMDGLIHAFRIGVALDGRRAKECIAETPPALVLAEVDLPVVDGIALCRYLKEKRETRHIPLLLLGDSGTEAVCREGFAAGAADFLIRTAAPWEVEARIRVHLSYRLALLSLEARRAALAEQLRNRTLQRETQDTHRLPRSGGHRHIPDGSTGFGKSSEFDLSQLVRETVRHFRKKAEERGFSLYLQMDNEIPLNVQGYPEQIRKVLGHLLTSAIRLNRSGGIMIRVTRETAEPANETDAVDGAVPVRFSVLDSRQGKIPGTEFQAPASGSGPHVCRRLQHPDMLLCSKILSGMAGELQENAAKGSGMSWSFLLFLKPAPGSVSREKTDQPDRRSLRVLMAEDSPVSAEMNGRILTRLGHCLEKVTDGKEALERLTRQHFDLVLMDIEMPEMDGLMASRAIRSGEAGDQNREIPIIGISAHISPDMQSRCRSAGMNAYLPKPLDKNRLVAILQQHCTAGTVRPEPATFEVLPPSGHTGPAAMVLDRDHALQHFGGDEAFYQYISSLFIDNIPDMIGKLRSAIETGNLRKVARQAHSLKGSFSTIGASTCLELAVQMEQKGRDGETEAVTPLFERLKTELEKVRSHLHRDVLSGNTSGLPEEITD